MPDQMQFGIPQTNPLAMGQLSPGYAYDQNGNIVYSGGQPLMQGEAYAGMPRTPYYNPLYNPQTEALTPGLQKQLGDINLGPMQQSVANFSDLANRQGPSAWGTLASQQQNALAENQLEQGGAQSQAATEGALGELGSSGGITSGARERAAEGGATNYMNMSQNVNRQNALNQLQIGVNDQQNKMQEMGMLPGMEQAALAPQFQEANMYEQAKQADVANQMAANAYANQYNLGLYQNQMQAWGANQQANATANSGKK